MDVYHYHYGDTNEIKLTFYNDPDDLSTLKIITGLFEDEARKALADGDIFLARDLLNESCHINECIDAMKAKGEENGQE
jgi:hypothetical protein